MEEQLDRIRAMRNIRPRAPGEQNPYGDAGARPGRAAIRKARALHRAAMAARRGTFIVSMALIVLGFLLQIVGAWPGCCPPWIAPQP